MSSMTIRKLHLFVWFPNDDDDWGGTNTHIQGNIHILTTTGGVMLGP